MALQRLTAPQGAPQPRRAWPVLALFGLMAVFAMQGASAKDGEVSQFTLNNGLRLVVKEDHRAPTVAHMVWYQAGSIDEQSTTTGVAHVLEHMMFKGTKTTKPGEFSRIVAGLGGRENAFTNRDYTAYFQQIQSKQLPRVMALEADRMANLRLSEAEFKKEIQVVMEERRWRTEDQAQGRLFEAFMATAFMANPTRNPVIGWMSDLEAMSYKDAQRWYQQWYAPNNAVVVVVGSVQPKAVLQWAQQSYGRIPAKALPQRYPQAEPTQQGTRRVEVKAPAENPYLIMGFKVPKLERVQEGRVPYALSVLAAVLDGYSGARLNRSLVQEQKLALSVGASYDMTGRGPTLFYLDGSPNPGQSVAELEKQLLAQVQKIAQEGITDTELARVKAQLVAGQVYKRDSVFGQAMELGQTLITGFAVEDIDRMIEGLKAVRAADVQEVAGQFFGPEGMTVGTLDPLPLDPKQPSKKPKGLNH